MEIALLAHSFLVCVCVCFQARKCGTITFQMKNRNLWNWISTNRDLQDLPLSVACNGPRQAPLTDRHLDLRDSIVIRCTHTTNILYVCMLPITPRETPDEPPKRNKKHVMCLHHSLFPCLQYRIIKTSQPSSAYSSHPRLMWSVKRGKKHKEHHINARELILLTTSIVPGRCYG